MKLFPYLKQGSNPFVFKEKNLITSENSRITISKVIIYWWFNNIETDTFVSLTAQDSTVTNVLFGEGYWTFSDIKQKLETEGVSLDQNSHNGTCRIHSEDYKVNLNDLGPLLGFQSGAVIQRGLTKDSKRVNINQSLEYVTLSCNIVDSEQVVDRFGEPGEIAAILPVDTSQRLNGTFTIFENVCFSAPIINGSFKQITFDIQDNLLSTKVKVHMQCECTIE